MDRITAEVVEAAATFGLGLFAITPSGDFSVLVEIDDPNLGAIAKVKRDERLAHVPDDTSRSRLRLKCSLSDALRLRRNVNLRAV